MCDNIVDEPLSCRECLEKYDGLTISQLFLLQNLATPLTNAQLSDAENIVSHYRKKLICLLRENPSLNTETFCVGYINIISTALSFFNSNQVEIPGSASLSLSSFNSKLSEAIDKYIRLSTCKGECGKK